MADTEKTVLICGRCKKNGIPAPAGATGKTKYTCKDCLRLMPGSGFVPLEDFNRRPFMSPGRRMRSVEQRWWDRQMALARAESSKSSRPSNDITVPELQILLKAHGGPLDEARSRGESWTRGLNLQKLCTLGEKQLQCLAMVELMGIKEQDVAVRLKVSRAFVHENLKRAKRALANMTRKSIRNNLITNELQTCNRYIM